MTISKPLRPWLGLSAEEADRADGVASLHHGLTTKHAEKKGGHKVWVRFTLKSFAFFKKRSVTRWSTTTLWELCGSELDYLVASLLHGLTTKHAEKKGGHKVWIRFTLNSFAFFRKRSFTRWSTTTLLELCGSELDYLFASLLHGLTTKHAEEKGGHKVWIRFTLSSFAFFKKRSVARWSRTTLWELCGSELDYLVASLLHGLTTKHAEEKGGHKVWIRITLNSFAFFNKRSVAHWSRTTLWELCG